MITELQLERPPPRIIRVFPRRVIFCRNAREVIH